MLTDSKLNKIRGKEIGYDFPGTFDSIKSANDSWKTN